MFDIFVCVCFCLSVQPGPIPGMRPPMGAGSVHQAQQKGNNMGLIMPLYTIGIVAFFVYTIMKVGGLRFIKNTRDHFYSQSTLSNFLQLVMKKSENVTPYPEPIKADSKFKEEVFRRGSEKQYGKLGMYHFQ